VAQRAIAAYNRRDFDALRALNHADVEVDWSASRGLEAGVYRGRDEVLRFFENFLEMFEDVQIVPEGFIPAGASIVVPNSAQLRGRDGIETVARSTLAFEIRDGQVVRLCLYQETQEALHATELDD
jgi:ketosteroid isomerase-like protein